jgi:hypothetical protein
VLDVHSTGEGIATLHSMFTASAPRQPAAAETRPAPGGCDLGCPPRSRKPQQPAVCFNFAVQMSRCRSRKGMIIRSTGLQPELQLALVHPRSPTRSPGLICIAGPCEPARTRVRDGCARPTSSGAWAADGCIQPRSRVKPASNSAGQPLSRVFERHRFSSGLPAAGLSTGTGRTTCLQVPLCSEPCREHGPYDLPHFAWRSVAPLVAECANDV